MIQELSLSPEMLDKIAELAGVAKEQSIEIAHEYLAWWFWQSVLTCSAWSVVAIAFAVLFWKIYPRFEIEDGPEKPVPWIFCGAISAIVIVVAVVSAAGNALDVVKISVAPRAYVIDKFLEKTR